MSMLSSGLSRLGAGIQGFTQGGLIGGVIGLLGGGGGKGGPPAPANPFGTPGGFNMPFPVKGPGGGSLPGFGSPQPASGGSCPRGYHMNKHALAASRSHGALPARSICVRNRSVNPLNHRALTRSLKRVKRASKLVAKLGRFAPARRLAAGGHRSGCGCFRCRKK